jgi:hypothetical protein
VTKAQRVAGVGVVFTVAAAVVIVTGQGSSTSTFVGITLTFIAVCAHVVALRLWFADRGAGRGT